MPWPRRPIAGHLAAGQVRLERVDTPGLVDAGQRHSPLLQAGALALIAGRTIFLPTQETKSIGPSLKRCPVNLCGSRTYIVLTRLASLSLVAVVLLTAGCHSHRYHDDDGWRDRDRDHRHHHRHDRDDDDDDNRQYRGDRYYR